MDPLTAFISGQRGALDVQQQRENLAQSQMQNQQMGLEGQQQQMQFGLQKAQLLGNAIDAVARLPQPQRIGVVNQLRPELQRFGIALPEMTEDQLTDQALQGYKASVAGFIQNPQQMQTAAIQDIEGKAKALVGAMNPETKKPFTLEEARQAIVLRGEGIVPRAGMSAQERIAQDQVLTQQVAESQKQIKTAEELGKGAAKLTSETITKSTDKIDKIGANLINIDRAISALDRGGKTGAFEQRLPAIDEATRELRVLQNQFGLDLLGSVTLGAISEAELELALKTGLDLGQDEESLKNQLIQKREAQRKLIDYLDEQVQFLDGGGTVPEWRAFIKGRAQSGQQSSQPSQPAAQQQKTFTSSTGIQFTVE